MKAFKKVISKNNLFREYVKILNGLLQLSDKECEVLAILLQINHNRDKLDNILDTNIRKFIMGELNIKKSNLSKYISSLKDRGVIMKDDNGYYINSMFIPEISGDISETVFILDIK